MNKICCFGDGYAANHIWPEWPAIVSALYPETNFINYGAVGAGNEFISSAIVQEHKKNPNAIFLVQWAQSNRFDKLLEDATWNQTIDSDRTYHFNRVKLNDQTWWLSSASTQEPVRYYHQHYIQLQQAQLRTFNSIYFAANLLSKNGIFFSTYKLNFTPDQWADLQCVPWIDIAMADYASQSCFTKIRQQEVQPSPPVQMQWVVEKVLPQMPRQPTPTRLTELNRRINAENWNPYDPDREEIWAKLIDF